MAAARTRKKAPAKKAATKKAAASDAATKKDAPAPIEGLATGELKFKMKAAQLEFEAESLRISTALQPQLNKLIDRTKRNDMKWKAANKARRDAINEFLEAEEPELPEGFAIINVHPGDGTYKAVHDPDSIGQRIQ